SSSEASFSSDAKEESSSTASARGNGKKDGASDVGGSMSGSGGSTFDAQAEVGSVVQGGKE
ncbi:hypothetical protein FRC01_009161, partial [Tulasnella sp. 417]